MKQFIITFRKESKALRKQNAVPEYFQSDNPCQTPLSLKERSSLQLSLSTNFPHKYSNCHETMT